MQRCTTFPPASACLGWMKHEEVRRRSFVLYPVTCRKSSISGNEWKLEWGREGPFLEVAERSKSSIGGDRGDGCWMEKGGLCETGERAPVGVGVGGFMGFEKAMGTRWRWLVRPNRYLRRADEGIHRRKWRREGRSTLYPIPTSPCSMYVD